MMYLIMSTCEVLRLSWSWILFHLFIIFFFVLCEVMNKLHVILLPFIVIFLIKKWFFKNADLALVNPQVKIWRLVIWLLIWNRSNQISETELISQQAARARSQETFPSIWTFKFFSSYDFTTNRSNPTQRVICQLHEDDRVL